MKAHGSTEEKHEVEASSGDAQHVDDVLGETYVNDAARGTEIEHELTFTQAARKYPAAIGWTVVVCLAWYGGAHQLLRLC